MPDQLSDAAILAAVEDALRLVGDGKASLASAGEALMRRILGLEGQPGSYCRPLHQDDGA